MMKKVPSLHFVAFLAALSTFTRYTLSAFVTCDNPQYGTIGEVGIIECSFQNTFNIISWSYAEEDVDPLVRYENGVIQGDGHDNGSYSIRVDGALLIIDAAERTGQKKYRVEVTDIDGEHSSQDVEYHFGEPTTSTSSSPMYITIPSTCPSTPTDECKNGCTGTIICTVILALMLLLLLLLLCKQRPSIRMMNKVLSLNFVASLAALSTFTRYALSAFEVTCQNPQNRRIGEVGIIECSFESAFKTISWSYASNGTKGAEPLVRYGGGMFQEHEHYVGSYSIRVDGALLIIDAAKRTGRKEIYKIEATDKDGNPSFQEVEYQFIGDSIKITSTSSINPEIPTTSPVTPTGESKCGSSEDQKKVPCWWMLITCAVIFVMGIILVGFVILHCCNKKKSRTGVNPPRTDTPEDTGNNGENIALQREDDRSNCSDNETANREQ